ncbi:Rad4 transglutaminase-like domain-containing protein [Ampelomyces quisqualis]|uniref:Rad4 transglutaminase-like domain-containing protein n=1 Tax=Ampelomyces quisqualis TaxID=50730 RepID=A0A6A5QH75_AMPQU|nr:Rad4 transglutaminase-like domain-containing protein [Ampelomyces quisqualis]
MPPVLSRKRLPSDSPKPEPPPKRTRASNPSARRSKESVFHTLDTAPRTKCTLSQTKAFLDQEDDDSELSEPESSEDEFENVPLNGPSQGKGKGNAEDDDDGEESVDDEWEDALGGQHHRKHDHGPAPVITGDIAVTLSAAPKTAFETRPDGKKGASKIQRQIRSVTHCMHVQFLMFHNLIRNAWIQDKHVQKTLVEGLSAGCWHEIDRYWRDVGVPDGSSRAVAERRHALKPTATVTNNRKGTWTESGKKGIQIYESPQSKRQVAHESRKKTRKSKAAEDPKSNRNARDWGAMSEPLEPDTPNISAGDPLMRLLRYLAAYWKSKFQITAPSLRKRGYLSPATLEAEVNAWKEHPSHPDTFGERITDIKAFREVAHRCQGSRDVGEQLFTALLRGLGIEARMVVSLQPVGFGFSQAEEGKAKNLDKLKDATRKPGPTSAKSTPAKGKLPQRAAKSGQKQLLDDQDPEDSDLSSVISISSDTDEGKAVKKSPKRKNYSEELPYPTYWTEAISRLTHTPISVSPFPRSLIASASSPDKLQDFYARGAAADKARQVLAYLIAFSSDGSAKDVTTRYLPKRQWPGRTKGFRMPIERIPIHNKRGKVKRWEEWDWFTSLMQSYARAHNKRQPWDEVEDEGDLMPAEPEKKKEMDEEGGKETLQGYKNSTEFVLERHLRREEALKPGAKVVRQFLSGKGDNEKSEPVYRRKDIVTCKTVESWHKEGREVKEGQQPLKFVPMRAVTVTRKREMEERERDEGVKPKQGLYSKEQTAWIIPPPIENGIIPRNAFNNIDVYVPTMVPRGAVHIPLKGTARICRKLNIEHAEACTGFDFGKQRAVPILTGVVVAVENEDTVIDAWEIEEAEKARKEAEKREKLVLSLWKKFLSGLRIVERMKAEYGEDVQLPAKESKPVPKAASKEKTSEWEVFQNHTDFEGGFLREDGPPEGGFVPEEPHHTQHDEEAGRGFFVASQEEPEHSELTIDHGDKEAEQRKRVAETSYQMPISLTSALQNPIDDADQEEDNDIMDVDVGHSKLSEENTPKPPARPKTTTPSIRGRRAAKPKATPARQRKSLLSSPDTLSSEDETQPTPPASTRSAPKRKAAKKSEAEVKSHFFARSEDETDLTDLTDRASPKKERKSGAGRGRGRGRGRGKGKGQ